MSPWWVQGLVYGSFFGGAMTVFAVFRTGAWLPSLLGGLVGGVLMGRSRTAFASALAAMVVLGVLLHLVLGRPGSPISSDALLDGMFWGLLSAAFVGWSFTRPPRRRLPRTR